MLPVILQTMKALLLLLPLVILTSRLIAEEARIWTSDSGDTFEGILQEVEEDNARIRRVADGRVFDLSFDRLSAADQEYLQGVLHDQLRMKGFEEGPYADAIRDEWVKFGAEKHGLVFQMYGSRKLSRSDEPVPLFIYLHGAGARADDVDPGSVEPMGKRPVREEQYEETPCVVLVPLCPPEVFWGAKIKELEALIDDVVDHLPIDRNRIYLSGYSMGARGIGSLLESRPNHYAAAVFADGEAKPEWAENVTAAIWLWFSGERNMDGAQKTADAFVAAGKVAHVELFPELTHNQIGYQLAQDEEVMSWVFEQRRGKE